jgi:hypothetical protein
MRKRIDLTDQKFGRLTAKKLVEPNRHRQAQWLCVCDCGNEKIISQNGLRSHNTTSCGCFQKEWARQYHLLRPYESLYNRLVNRHKIDFVSLTYEDFVEFTKIHNCHYCNAKIHWAIENTKKNGTACNLDRKDSTVGYTVENCVVCCKRCNIAKMHHFSYNQWKQIGWFMQENSDLYPEVL